jgi:anti-sigma regulatory factor (Ser/Thr protein kinase)/Fe-S-cluster-containing hydrogenase component 2
MRTDTYTISGGDYERAGFAAGRLKEKLKRIGVEKDIVRRAVIAAYEAEMNVVIHARKGTLQVMLDTDRVDVQVTDEGPGIPDIDQAMQEGFSTAPAAARELGFGAGMGLPNMKKNSDLFAIDSTVGRGTTVTFTIYLAPLEAYVPAGTSIRVAAKSCRECLHCLHACPTQALRVRGGSPRVLQHLCIDCTACIGTCVAGALTMVGAVEVPEPSDDTILIVPSAFLFQFGAQIGPREVLAGLAEIGFRDVRTTQAWDDALRGAVAQYMREEARSRPVFSPVCPAVVNLIEMRFPSLLGNVAPFCSPLEAMCKEFAERQVVVLAVCPSHRTALLSRGPVIDADFIVASSVRHALLPLLSAGKVGAVTTGGGPHQARGQNDRRIVRVSGIKHVMAVLEKAEDGLLGDIDVIEPFACDQGCFGSPLLSENPFIARSRWLEGFGTPDVTATAIRRPEPFVARAGLRLDEDMAKAIEKLSRIDEMTRNLPGKDCGRCGAPTCSAFAEDVVLERVDKDVCVYLGGNEETAT